MRTPLTMLRKAAPGSITLSDISKFFEKRRYPRKTVSIGAFERGQIKEPPQRFIELWAEAVGQDVATVVAALRKTQRARETKSGPFARSKAA